MVRRFIESGGFPFRVVSLASWREKRGGGRPPYWEMVFWWTRKPLAGARAVVAGSVLPASVSADDFLRWLRLGDGVAHRRNPKLPPEWREVFGRVRLLDPFAGFGSIPLEAVRLGVGEVVAVDLLPTAYVFLKAVLEFPKWAAERGLGQKLVEDVRRWGEWVAERLRNDPDIKELYNENTAVYIGTWEIKCPHCGRWTPLVGNWWLARVKKRNKYRRLAWMEPVVGSDRVSVRVVDLSKELGGGEVRAVVDTEKGTVKVGGRVFRVPPKNVDARRSVARCLLCGNAIAGRPWYVKEAIRDWNRKLEDYLTGHIATVEELMKNVKARPRLLTKVKIVNKNLVFEPATEEDNKKLWKALQKLKQIWGDPDIPTEELWKYITNGGGALSIWIWGFDRFYKLFNPRQLLTLVKLVKLIREAGKGVEEEKLKQGWNKDGARKYAEALTTYLAIAFSKLVNYNSITTRWDSTWWKIGETLSTRGIAMNWNWCDVNPASAFIGSWSKSLSSIITGLSYLVSVVSGSSSRVRVLRDDATVLSRLEGEDFDVVVTDPPYRDDVPYAELSDFYYVWLKRALSDVVDVGGVPMRVPRFVQDAFFEGGVEIETQWRHLAHREVSEVWGRKKFFGDEVGTQNYFSRLLSEAFKKMVEHLKDDGVIVTYYAHTSPEAWAALLHAGWVTARMRITTTTPLITESTERVTARNKGALDTSIVAVWHGKAEGFKSVREVYAEAVETCTEFAKELLDGKNKESVNGFRALNIFVSTLGCVLSVFTKYRKITGIKVDARNGSDREKERFTKLVEKYMFPATFESIVRAVGTRVESSGAVGNVSFLDPVGRFYLIVKTLITPDTKEEFKPRQIDRSTLRILALGAKIKLDDLERHGIIEKRKDAYYLVEPVDSSVEAVNDVDRKRLMGKVGHVNLDKILKRFLVKGTLGIVFKNAVDVLSTLEYYALTLPENMFREYADMLRESYPSLFKGAVFLARAINHVTCNTNDPEYELTYKLLRKLNLSGGICRGDLRAYQG